MKFTDGISFEEFNADDKTFSAVIRKIEIIGEAVKNLSTEIKDAEPGISWSAIARMRDRLIHGYFGVDAAIVWKTVKTDLPEMLPEITKLYVKHKDQ